MPKGFLRCRVCGATVSDLTFENHRRNAHGAVPMSDARAGKPRKGSRRRILAGPVAVEMRALSTSNAGEVTDRLSAAELRYRELRARVDATLAASKKANRLVLLTRQAEPVDVLESCRNCGVRARPLWFCPKTSWGPFLLCSSCRGKYSPKKHAGKRGNPNWRTISAGAFETNRRRH